MAEPPPYPGMPRWLKVSGIIVVVLVLLVVVIMVTGVGGQHGPSRHIPPVEHRVQLTPILKPSP